MVELRDKNEES